MYLFEHTVNKQENHQKLRTNFVPLIPLMNLTSGKDNDLKMKWEMFGQHSNAKRSYLNRINSPFAVNQMRLIVKA